LIGFVNGCDLEFVIMFVWIETRSEVDKTCRVILLIGLGTMITRDRKPVGEGATARFPMR
jgi:hypothetical protein